MAALGVDLDHATLQTIRQTSNSELGDLEKRRRTDKPLMNITDADAKKWVDFITTVAEVTRTIKNKFEVRLSELGPSLERLSRGLGLAADEFIDKDLGPWISGLAEGLESLSKTVDSDSTKRIVRAFFDDMKIVAESMAKLVHGLADAARWLGIANPAGTLATAGGENFGGTDQERAAWGGGGGARLRHGGGRVSGDVEGGGNGSPAPVDPNNPVLRAIHKSAGGDPWVEKTMQGIYSGESAHKNRWDVGDVNDGGAYGPFQFNMGRGRLGDDFQRDTGLDPRNPSSLQSMADYTAKKLRSMRTRGQSPVSVWHGLAHTHNPLRGGYAPGLKLQGETPAPAAPVTTKKVSIRNQPGGDIFAMGFGNVYGAA
jgi:hypothetical protein